MEVEFREMVKITTERKDLSGIQDHREQETLDHREQETESVLIIGRDCCMEEVITEKEAKKTAFPEVKDEKPSKKANIAQYNELLQKIPFQIEKNSYSTIKGELEKDKLKLNQLSALINRIFVFSKLFKRGTLSTADTIQTGKEILDIIEKIKAGEWMSSSIPALKTEVGKAEGLVWRHFSSIIDYVESKASEEIGEEEKKDLAGIVMSILDTCKYPIDSTERFQLYKKVSEFVELKGKNLEGEVGELQKKQNEILREHAAKELEVIKRDITETINKWNPVGAEFGEEDKALIKSVKSKLVQEDNLEELATFYYQGSCFDTLVGEYGTKGALLFLFEESETTMFSNLRWLPKRSPRFVSGLNDTIGDIVYWGKKKGAKDVKSISFTGSDVHERGLGVSIVTYVVGRSTEKYVIKPDERWAEYALLSDNDESFVSSFNKSLAEGKIEVSEKNGKTRTLSTSCQLRRIKMEIGNLGDGRSHGTLVEYIPHKRMTQKGKNSEIVLTDKEKSKIDEDEEAATLIFCALLGITDLHTENIVYVKEGKRFRPVLIDADVLLRSNVIGNLTGSTSAGTTFGGFRERAKEYVSAITPVELLEKALNKLFDPQTGTIRTRCVPCATPTHYSNLDGIRGIIEVANIRNIIAEMKEKEASQLLQDIEQWESMPETSPEEEDRKTIYNIASSLEDIFTSIKEYYPHSSVQITDENKKNIIISALQDYYDGQIPYYEFEPSTGKITTHGGRIEVATVVLGETMEGRQLLYSRAVFGKSIPHYPHDRGEIYSKQKKEALEEKERIEQEQKAKIKKAARKAKRQAVKELRRAYPGLYPKKKAHKKKKSAGDGKS